MKRVTTPAARGAAFFMVAFLSILLSVAVADRLIPADFSYCTDVQGTVRADALYQVHLTDELLRNSGANLEDVRLFNTSGSETPMTVIDNVPPHETIETYPLEIAEYDSDPTSATAILKLPQQHGAVSALEFDIADRNFKKRITLSASSDGKTWQKIGEDSIFDFSSQVNVRRTRIEFPKTRDRFLRVKLLELKPGALEQSSIKLTYEGLDFAADGTRDRNLRIRAVHAYTGTPAEKKPVYDQKTFPSPTASLDKEGNTVIVLFAGLPLDKLTFDVANPYFHRTVNIYGSSTGKEDSYRFLASQLIYRFPLTAEQHEDRAYIEYPIQKQAFYKIVIINRNNPPLDVKSITAFWIQKNLYFIGLKNGERYSLCYGNAQIKRPDYDLVNFVNKDTLSKHPYERLELAPVQTGSGPRLSIRARLAGMEKTILTVVVILLVIGMGWWLFSLLKKKDNQA